MFVLGHLVIGNYMLWVTQEVFSKVSDVNLVSGSAPEIKYFYILLSQKKDLLYNVDIFKDFNYLFNLTKALRPIENVTDMIQYQYYLDNKHIPMPLTKLSKENVILLIQKLQELSVGIPDIAL